MSDRHLGACFKGTCFVFVNFVSRVDVGCPVHVQVDSGNTRYGVPASAEPSRRFGSSFQEVLVAHLDNQSLCTNSRYVAGSPARF